jgi:hypothetical protein
MVGSANSVLLLNLPNLLPLGKPPSKTFQTPWIVSNDSTSGNMKLMPFHDRTRLYLSPLLGRRKL